MERRIEKAMKLEEGVSQQQQRTDSEGYSSVDLQPVEK